MTSDRIVPGRMVERMTTRCGLSSRRSTAPICWHTRSSMSVLRLPFGRDGVPTQISEMSLSATASSADVVARSRPAATASAIISGNRASMTGERPWFIRSTFTCCVSAPTTRAPVAARHAAETLPT